MKNYKGLIEHIFLITTVDPYIPATARSEIWNLQKRIKDTLKKGSENEEYMKNIYQISLYPIIKKYDIRDYFDIEFYIN